MLLMLQKLQVLIFGALANNSGPYVHLIDFQRVIRSKDKKKYLINLIDNHELTSFQKGKLL